MQAFFVTLYIIIVWLLHYTTPWKEIQGFIKNCTHHPKLKSKMMCTIFIPRDIYALSNIKNEYFIC